MDVAWSAILWKRGLQHENLQVRLVVGCSML
jgi:hypothetical protein